MTIADAAHEDANIIFGSVIDESFGEDVKITVGSLFEINADDVIGLDEFPKKLKLVPYPSLPHHRPRLKFCHLYICIIMMIYYCIITFKLHY